MSLNYDFTDITGYKALHDDDEQWQITQAVIWSLLFTDTGTITNDNVEEVYFRVALWERLNGPLLRDGDKGVNITLADLIRRIGLHTNVATMTRTKWIKKVIGQFEKDELNAARRHPEGKVA